VEFDEFVLSIIVVFWVWIVCWVLVVFPLGLVVLLLVYCFVAFSILFPALLFVRTPLRMTPVPTADAARIMMIAVAVVMPALRLEVIDIFVYFDVILI
jgi:hypothetical protein